LERGYVVHGIKRRSSSFNTARIDHLMQHEYFKLHYGDVTDVSNLLSLFQEVAPDEIYNLAAQSHVQVSFELPCYTTAANAQGSLNVFEAARVVCPGAYVYQASSSEMFGNATTPKQNEDTPLAPVSPYGASKVYAHQMAAVYREAYGLNISCGILFNHESPRRGETFFPSKLVRAAVAIKHNRQKNVQFGNTAALRDWGWAPEYVEAMTSIIGTNQDFVVGTGVKMRVMEAITLVFSLLGLDHTRYVEHDESYDRPFELNSLCADSRKAHEKLGWQPKIVGHGIFIELLETELKRVYDELGWGGGYHVLVTKQESRRTGC